MRTVGAFVHVALSLEALSLNRDGAITVEDPERVGRGFGGEGGERDTSDSEVGVSVSNPDRMKELFYIKHMTS